MGCERNGAILPAPSSGGVSEDILVAADRSAGRCLLINGSRAGVQPLRNRLLCAPLSDPNPLPGLCGGCEQEEEVPSEGRGSANHHVPSHNNI